MKMKITKIMAFLLCCLMLIAAFAACNTKNPEVGGSESGEAVSESESGEDKPPEQSAADQALNKLIAKNYDYKSTYPEFNMLVNSREVGSFRVEVGETGILIDDAVFLRNTTFEETFGVKINVEEVQDGNFRTALSQDIKSDGMYDVLIDCPNNAISYAQEGLLYSFLELENLNLDMPWWDQGTKSFVIADSLFFMDGSFNFGDESMTYVLMFNKNMYEDRKHEIGKSFYDSVKDSEWTLDYFGVVTQGVSSDANGDDVWDERDTYGFVTTDGYGVSFFYGSNLCFTKCGEGSDPYIDFGKNMIEKSVKVLDKVLDIYYTNNATYYPPAGKENLGFTAFSEGRALFYGEIVSYIGACDKKMTDPFGILPIPKYDKEQEEYHSWASPIYCTMMLGHRVDDNVTLGALIEGFNIVSEKQLRPVYYDTVLMRKSLKDEESRDMLDYIFRGRIYDFANFNPDWNLLYTFRTCVNNRDTSYASKIESVSQSAQSRLARLIKTINKKYG